MRFGSFSFSSLFFLNRFPITFRSSLGGCYGQPVTSSPILVGDVIDVTTERLAYGGDAIARHEGLAIFVPFAAPGELLRVRITERKKNFARAIVDRILEASPTRRDPRCRYFGECGGCQLQHISYDAQLEAKIGFVRDALERIGRIDWPREINIRHRNEFSYRGRAQVKIDRKTARIGFNRASSNAVCDVSECPILVPELDAGIRSLRSALENSEPRLPNRFEVEMAAGESGISFEPALEGLPGGPLLRIVGRAVYRFGPSTFFQANPGLLDDLIAEAVGDEAGTVALDLYAGVGLFTIQLASRFTRVIGVEADSGAAEFARQNIRENHATNVEFHNGKVELWLNNYLDSKGPSPDFLLLDPPRTGAADAISKIVKLNPARVTYVSCDPATLARDLRMLIDSGYELSRIAAVDLFPQTYHVETVAALVRG